MHLNYKRFVKTKKLSVKLIKTAILFIIEKKLEFQRKLLIYKIKDFWKSEAFFLSCFKKKNAIYYSNFFIMLSVKKIPFVWIFLRLLILPFLIIQCTIFPKLNIVSNKKIKEINYPCSISSSIPNFYKKKIYWLREIYIPKKCFSSENSFKCSWKMYLFSEIIENNKTVKHLCICVKQRKKKRNNKFEQRT